MKTSDFYYDLPHELIAQTPIKDRSAARMLCYNMQEKTMHDEVFTDILKHLKKGDVLVRNTPALFPQGFMATGRIQAGLWSFCCSKGLMITATRRSCALAKGQSRGLYIKSATN